MVEALDLKAGDEIEITIAGDRQFEIARDRKRFITELAAGESDVERLGREERALRERITTFRAADRLPREDVHRRRP